MRLASRAGQKFFARDSAPGGHQKRAGHGYASAEREVARVDGSCRATGAGNTPTARESPKGRM